MLCFYLVINQVYLISSFSKEMHFYKWLKLIASMFLLQYYRLISFKRLPLSGNVNDHPLGFFTVAKSYKQFISKVMSYFQSDQFVSLMNISMVFIICCQFNFFASSIDSSNCNIEFPSDAFDTEQLLCVMEKLRHGQAVDIPNYDLKSYKNNVFPARRVQLSYLLAPVGIILHITAIFLCKDPLQISSEWQLLALIVFVVIFLPIVQ